jgi:thymidine phosphorylase
VIQKLNTRQIGVAANALGAGRIKVTDKVDTTVGIRFPWKVGDKVSANDEFLLLHNDRNVDQAERMLLDAITIGDAPVDKLPLIIEEFHA